MPVLHERRVNIFTHKNKVVVTRVTHHESKIRQLDYTLLVQTDLTDVNHGESSSCQQVSSTRTNTAEGMCLLSSAEDFTSL